MTYRTVHIDGTGELRAMNLDHRQADGERCAVCGASGHLKRIGELVGPRTDIKVCANCRI